MKILGAKDSNKRRIANCYWCVVELGKLVSILDVNKGHQIPWSEAMSNPAESMWNFWTAKKKKGIEIQRGENASISLDIEQAGVKLLKRFPFWGWSNNPPARGAAE